MNVDVLIEKCRFSICSRNKSVGTPICTLVKSLCPVYLITLGHNQYLPENCKVKDKIKSEFGHRIKES